MASIVRILLAVLVIGYLGACAALFLLQRSLIYFPQPGGHGDGAGTLRLPVADAQVRASVRPHAGRKALIYFGGNAEDVSVNLPTLSAAFPEHAIYLLHYRAYGQSSGKPTETALHSDALALFDMVSGEHPDITLIGRSLGSGIAVRVASCRPVVRLILVTPYDSLQEIAANQYPYFPVRWLLQDKYESWRYAPLVRAPTLLIAAEHDDVIPRASTALLHSRFAAGVAHLEIIAQTDHNNISTAPGYLALISAAQ